jgi:hypothetical protein
MLTSIAMRIPRSLIFGVAMLVMDGEAQRIAELPGGEGSINRRGRKSQSEQKVM